MRMMRALLFAAIVGAIVAVSMDTDPRADASHAPGDMMSIRHSGGDPGPYGPGGTALNVAVGSTFNAEVWVDASSGEYGGYNWEIAYDPAYVVHTGQHESPFPVSGTFTLCHPGTTQSYAGLILFGAGCLSPGPSSGFWLQYVGEVRSVELKCIAPTYSPLTTSILLIAMDPSEDAFVDPNYGATLVEAGYGQRYTSTQYKGPSPFGGTIAQITVRCLEPALDPDNDGCSNAEETSVNQLAGGKRDPFDGNDFFDVPAPALKASMPNGLRNKAVGLIDVGAVLAFVGATNDGMPNPNGYDYDSDFNANSIDDGAEYDRTPSVVMGQPWRSGRPNGAVSLMDVGVSLAQVGTNCVPPP